MGQRFGPAVVIVDTSSEIGGLGDKPHEVVRKSRVRRVPVHDREKQHQVLLEVVQNHSPSVIVVDEIRDRKEATVVRTIANRGVSVIATAHGTTLQDLLDNNELNSVAGGANSVIYSAKEVEDRRKKAGPRTGAADEGKKTGLNRKEAVSWRCDSQLQFAVIVSCTFLSLRVTNLTRHAHTHHTLTHSTACV